MKTIKLPYKTDEDLTCLLKQYSSVVKFSYNRFLEGKTEKDIRALTKGLNNIDTLNAWIVQCGIKDAKARQTRFGADYKSDFRGPCKHTKLEFCYPLTKHTWKKY